MPDEIPFNDPRKIWQDQPKETTPMSLNEIRHRVQELQAKSRWGALTWIVLGLALSVMFAGTAAKGPNGLPRLGWAILSIWGLWGAFQAYKWIWPRTLASDANWSTSADFYRRELERKRDYGRHIWIRSGLWLCFLGLALVVAPGLIAAIQSPRLLLNMAPFFLLMAIWIISFFFLRKREREKLRREIDELERLKIDPESRI